jgi:LysM repeat protein
MRLAPFASGLAIAVSFAVIGTPAAHAQVTNNQNPKTDQKHQSNTVVVNTGDTLDGIATDHQTTYVRLFDANNNIQDPNVIYPGDNVRIPAPNEQLPDRPLPADAAPVAATAPAAQSQSAAATYQAPVAKPVATVPVAQSAPVSGCGDNSYANFIYSHESGCRTTAMSPNGCYGIGQACPASKLAYCGADYACQNAFFTAYAGKYGGWAGAYSFWVAHGWW